LTLTRLLAHQGGWDEIAPFAIGVLVMWWWFKRRARETK